MYCAHCGTPLTQGLSYCNRCGANLKEQTEVSTGAISAFLTAITLIGITGLGIMFVGVTEIMLVRSLRKVTSGKETEKYLPASPPVPQDLRLNQGMPLGEPVSSV